MTTEGVKRKVTAILSADVKGYSRLMEEDEAATVQTLKAYREVMTSLIQQYHGRVVDSPGDNLLAEFTSVVEAVDCSVRIQSELKAKNAGLPENRQMEFRIGINLGDVIEDGERIYGDGINIAARIEGLAAGGGICISRTAYDSMKNKLSLGYEYLGEHTVKNISEPVRVYRVLMEPKDAGKVIGEKRPKRWRWAAIAVAVLLVLGGLAIWNYYFRTTVEPASLEKMAFPLPDEPSIAVLPFTNMSGDPQQEYFSDGLTEQIITSLSMAPRLFVIARNSTFTYKGKAVKVQQVAEEMGVRYVLEGSVQRSGERIRITAQLIDALTGRHLWAQRYDRDLKDLFALQDEIIMKIMSAIPVKLRRGAVPQVWKKGTDNLEAYIKVMQGAEHFFRFNKEGNIQARKLYEEAIALDPEYASAYFRLGQTHYMDVRFGLSKSPRNSFQESARLFQKALAIDESHPYANSLLAFVYGLQRQHEKSLAQAERAVSLYPNMAVSNVNLGAALFRVGRYEEAIQLIEKGIRLNPKGPWPYFAFLGHAYCYAGRYEEAIAAVKRGMARAPASPMPYVALAAIYSIAGREEEARAEAAEVLRLDPKFSLERHGKFNTWRKAEKEPWFEALRKAGLPETPPLPLPNKPSIAVLPFVNMSGDPEQEYFSDGITEEIITALSKTAKLFVIARTSSFKYKGKEVDIRRVGRELGVRYVLEGSVRRSEDRLRVTAQLVEAKTGNHLWAQRYDRDLKDIFALQDEITMKIITALEVELTEGETARLVAKGTHNLMAYLNHLRAREHWRRQTREGVISAQRFLKEAIALDPEYPAPYHLLGTTHLLAVWLQMTKSPEQSIKRAIQLAQKAIALDDSFASAHGLLGSLYVMLRQHDKGIVECRRAVALNPNGATSHVWLTQTLMFSGECEEAVQMGEKAIRLNPFPPGLYFRILASAYNCVDRYEEAIAACKKVLNLNPNDLFNHLVLASAYSRSGREEKARAQAEEVLKINPRFSLEKFAKRLPYKNPAETERIVEALRKAGLK